MNLVTICREEGRKQATEWLKGAIDAPNPYVLMATGARNSAAPALMAGVVSEAYWEKVGGLLASLLAANSCKMIHSYPYLYVCDVYGS